MPLEAALSLGRHLLTGLQPPEAALLSSQRAAVTSKGRLKQQAPRPSTVAAMLQTLRTGLKQQALAGRRIDPAQAHEALQLGFQACNLAAQVRSAQEQFADYDQQGLAQAAGPPAQHGGCHAADPAHRAQAAGAGWQADRPRTGAGGAAAGSPSLQFGCTGAIISRTIYLRCLAAHAKLWRLTCLACSTQGALHAR